MTGEQASVSDDGPDAEGGALAELVLIGGRSGAGKSSVALALHAQLVATQVRHAVIEGDYLDLAWPAPWEHGLAERNLAAMWEGYRELGYRRLVLTNTVSVLRARQLADALGEPARVWLVLLGASDDVVADRLSGRESGEELAAHVARSAAAARKLDVEAPPQTLRIATDGRAIDALAGEIRRHVGW